MESNNQSTNVSKSSGDSSSTEKVTLLATYHNMALTLMVVVIVTTPVVMVVCIICKTKELHTKYYFFVANLLATNIINILFYEMCICLIKKPNRKEKLGKIKC